MATLFSSPNLPDETVCQYANVSFGGATVKSNVKTEFVKDDAGRVVKYNRYTIDITGYARADSQDDLENDMQGMRRALSQPGQTFLYSDKGFGPIQVGNGEGLTPDAEFGPWPKVLTFRPLGTGGTAYVEFTVTVAIPDHCANAKTAGAFSMVNFGMSFSIDDAGYTTQTYDIVAEIPMTRTANDKVPDSIDNYLEKLVPPLPLGFRREFKNRNISKDRRRIECSVVDTEMAWALPEGTAVMKTSQRVRAKMPFREWQITLRATVTVPRGAPPQLAWFKFYVWLAARWAVMTGKVAANGQLLTFTSQAKVNQAVQQGTIPPGVHLVYFSDVEYGEEDSFGKPSSNFVVNIRMVGSALNLILQDSGMYIMPNTDFASWRTSLLPNVFNPRGAAGLKLTPQQDALIDLCTTAPVTPSQMAPEPQNDPATWTIQPAPGASAGKGFNLPAAGNVNDPATWNLPPPAAGVKVKAAGVNGAGVSSSNNITTQNFAPAGAQADPRVTWLYYQTSLTYVQDNRIARNKPLAGTVTVQAPAVNALGNVAALAANTSPTATGISATVPDILQRISAPTATVRLRGMAVRAEYPINPPRLVSIAGVPAVEARQTLVPGPVNQAGGFTIFSLYWDIEYYLPTVPATIPSPANPVLNVSGTATPTTPLPPLQMGITAP